MGTEFAINWSLRIVNEQFVVTEMAPPKPLAVFLLHTLLCTLTTEPPEHMNAPPSPWALFPLNLDFVSMKYLSPTLFTAAALEILEQY